MRALPPNIPYNESGSISELCASTKCDVEVDQDEDREMSGPPKIIPDNKSKKISELFESTKSEVETIQHKISEISDTPTEKGDDLLLLTAHKVLLLCMMCRF